MVALSGQLKIFFYIKEAVPESFGWASYIPNEKEAQMRFKNHENFVTNIDAHANDITLSFHFMINLLDKVYIDVSVNEKYIDTGIHY